MDASLTLTYLLANDSALISSNHPITVEFDNNKYKYNGTYIIKKNKKTNIWIQGHMLDDYIRELKQSDVVLPLIIKDDRAF